METVKQNKTNETTMSRQVQLGVSNYDTSRRLTRPALPYQSAYHRVSVAPAHMIDSADIITLQQTIGNRAVGQLLHSKMIEQKTVQRRAAPEDEDETETQTAHQLKTANIEENETATNGQPYPEKELTGGADEKSIQPFPSSSTVQRMVEVNPGLELNTMGYTTTKSGDVYSCPVVVKSSIWNELFTSILHSPRVFKLKGTTNAEINKSFKDHMIARYGIVNFASKKRYSFGAGAAFKMNPKYWNVDASGWEMKPSPPDVAPEVWRREALNDLNVNPHEYSIACLAATKLTMLGGSGAASLKLAFVNDINDWIPGDWGYITNTNFVNIPANIGREGENIIYVGRDKFWGHLSSTNTYKTRQEWYDKVKSWDNGAVIEDTREYPDTGLE